MAQRSLFYPVLSSLCCKAQEQPALFSLLVGLPKGFWAPVSHSCSCYQRCLISIECFGRSKADLCSKASPMQSDHTESKTLSSYGCCASFLVCPTLGRFITSGAFWCCLLQVSAFCYAQSYKQIFFLDFCTVCGDAVVSEYFCATSAASPAPQMLFFCFVHLFL